MSKFEFGARVLVKKKGSEEHPGIVVRVNISRLYVVFPSDMAQWFGEEKVRLDPDHYPEAKEPELSAIPDKWKMRVTPEESKQVQERLFQLGYKWCGGQTEVINTDEKFLFFNISLSCSYGSYINYFHNQKKTEITPQAFLAATEHLVKPKIDEPHELDFDLIDKNIAEYESKLGTQTGITKVTLNSMGHLVTANVKLNPVRHSFTAKLRLGEPVDFNTVKSQESEYDALKQTVSEMRDYTPAPQPVYKCPLYMYPHVCGEVGTKGEIIKHVKKDHEGERAPSEKSAVWNMLEVR